MLLAFFAFAVHVRGHMGLKPYKCTQCDYTRCVPLALKLQVSFAF